MTEFKDLPPIEAIKPEETIKQAELLVEIVTERIESLKRAIDEAEQKMSEIDEKIAKEKNESQKLIYIQGKLFISSLLSQARQQLKDYVNSLPENESILKAAQGALN